MRLVTYRATVETEARLGALSGDVVVDLARFGAVKGVPFPSTMLEFIDLGPQAVAVASRLIDEAAGLFPVGTTVPLANVKLLAPIPRPRKNIFGIGLNYTEHVAESAKSLDTSPELPRQPVIFSKPPTSVIGPNE
ncbi:MAG: fumarylacetoacetate hydrolase family protein, partial [Sphingobium sp.]